MKKHFIHTRRQAAHCGAMPGLASVPEPLRQLISAAYAVFRGPELMKLSDWRDLELELKRKLENEKRQRRG